MGRFTILKSTEPGWARFLTTVNRHLESLREIRENLRGIPGESFVQGWIDTFHETGSPIFVNLDHNVSNKATDIDELITKSEEVTRELLGIVKATAGHVSAYKMNEQSMLTFLIARKPKFVHEAKAIYRDECEDRFGVSITPQVWTDEKLRDIPSTTFQTANIIYTLGYDAIHCMPQIGPDVSGALQIAAERNKNKGTIHVVNMTHDGYRFVKNEYFQNDAIEKMRKNALGNMEYEIDTGEKPNPKARIRATGIIEPANRPNEIYEGFREVYGKKLMILSIGIGPQGALPGCALYAGATCEGIGRFIFRGKKGIESYANMRKKARSSKRCGLMALEAKFSSKPYPLSDILYELKEFSPSIRDETKVGLDKIYRSWK